MKIRLLIFLSMGVIFLSCIRKENSIKIKGSDTEVNVVVRLAEEYHKSSPDVYLSVSGGGSGIGITSLLNGQADIANSSRRINEYESRLFIERQIDIDTLVFAEDAVAFVVSSDLPIDTILADDLGRILSGVHTNWRALAGVDMPITIYGRPSNSGTHEFVRRKLGIEFSEYSRQMNGNAQIIEAIKSDRSGIGYVGAGYIRNGVLRKWKIKVLRISATRNDLSVSPLDSIAIAGNRYFFQRPLYQYIRSESLAKVSAFIAFERSSRGLKIIKSSGYYPVGETKLNNR